MTGDELATILTAAPDAGYPAWARFDADFYRVTNPTVGIRAGEAPEAALLRHYIQVGRFQGASPNAWFDEAWYLARHGEVADLVADGRPIAGSGAIESGFEHYLLLGHASLSPHWLFDAPRYREQVSERALAAGGSTDLYDHYLRSGARRGITAHALFEPDFYREANGVTLAALPAEGAYGHYLTRLWRDAEEGWTSPDIDLVATRRDAACNDAIAEASARGALHHGLAAGGLATFPPALATGLRNLAAEPSLGGIDIVGAHEAAGGWFVAGWLGRAGMGRDAVLLAPGEPVVIALRMAHGTLAARATIGLFPRQDLEGRGDGFLAFIPAAEGLASGEIRRIHVVGEAASWCLPMPPDLRPTPASGLAPALRPIAERLLCPDAASAIGHHLAHPVPDGGDTLAQLPERVLFEVDEAMRLPDGALLLAGWHLARPGAVRAIRLRRGWRSRPIRLEQGIVIERPDVRDTVGRETGLAKLRCGFMLRLSGVFRPGEDASAGAQPCIEIELESGAIAHRPVTVGSRAGLAAIRFILDRTDPPFGDAATPFDRVAGPAIAALQASRMAEPAHARRLDFGQPHPAPRVSVIVTLYGRVDFLDFQLGIEAAQLAQNRGPAPAIERLYVLDDPPRARETENLAAGAHLRFALPFSLLSLGENRGFAGANNAGLGEARGTYVCFLNSDVFPGTRDWALRLADRLDADPTLGAIGARLLYEDGSIQHDGMTFRRVPRVGPWRFPDHPGKGLRPDASRGAHRVIAATGACLMMRRDLAIALGGFDEAYPVGDFEDSDLCMKLHAMGLGIAVDRDTVLYHLERQSQAGSAEHWRMQLTLFNAWQHERRWQRLLDRPLLNGAERA